MKTAIILAAGKGSKIWPYAEIRSKTMIPISNKPIIDYTIGILKNLGFDRILIVAGPFSQEIKHYYAKDEKIIIINDDKMKGTALSLLLAESYVEDEKAAVFYGDVILEEDDIELLLQSSQAENCSALVSKISGVSGDYIGCTVEHNKIKKIYGHSMEESTHFFCGFIFPKAFFEVLKYNSGRFTNTEVGMMSPIESYLEMSLADYIREGNNVNAIEARKEVYDIDKPWHILEANVSVNRKLCSELKSNTLGEDSKVDPSAYIKGKIKLGKNSIVGKNVIVEGNIIVGDNTVIENGAILKGNNIIGNNSYIGNYCYIEEGSTVGNECVVNHCAELFGIIMDRVYLYHYMEFYGVIGENTDLGAATVCGTLRFDNGITPHFIRGRREMPKKYSEATYMGDYCRTGVNAIIMPGCKIGAYSVIGPGVILNEDVPNNSLIYVEQNLVKKHWNHEKYGW